MPEQHPAAAANIPLCVECSGTLFKSDLRDEIFVAALAQGLRRRCEGSPGLLPIDLHLVPENAGFVAWLCEQRKAGRRLILCSASDAGIAREIAARFDLFDEIIAAPAGMQAGGEQLVGCLTSRFGVHGFDYAGSGPADLPVWRQARHAIVVSRSRHVASQLSDLPRVERIFGADVRSSSAWISALRWHHWSKNLLVFLPAAAGHRLLVPDVAARSLLAFMLFGLCASAAYLWNDLLDLNADRRHPLKCRRPFAAAQLSPLVGLWAASALVIVALASALLWLGLPFFIVLTAYVAATAWYSIRLKRIPVVDVLALAGFYGLRVLAGGAATGIVLSWWLLAFTLFLFLGLAIAKRYAELSFLSGIGRQEVAGRSYTPADAPMLRKLGLAAGGASMLVLSLYATSSAAAAMYRRPALLWALCPLLAFWLVRFWRMAIRDRMRDDPVAFMLRDWSSAGVAIAGLLVTWLAT